MIQYEIDTEKSPIERIDTSFAHYVEKRKQEASVHMNGSVPDYAFALDYELRAKLDQIPHFQSLCKKITSTIETRTMQEINQGAMQVGPNQFPEIYEMGVDCAHRLGIGIPNIYIVNSTDMNAYTMASDDTSPLLVLYTGIVDRMTPGELKAVIGHECGHIHNRHCVYENVINKLLVGASGLTGSFVLSMANMALMQFWTRAAEVTADRAAMICSDNIQDALSVNAKLGSGGTLNTSYQQTMDLDTLHDQLEMTLNNPTRLLELQNDHPAFARRIFCGKEFEQSEILYSWRPELKKPGMQLRSKKELDERCKKLVNIVNNK